ncbi:MAG: hypothetical protein WKF91_15970, partial [Segetibacter sp.]
MKRNLFALVFASIVTVMFSLVRAQAVKQVFIDNSKGGMVNQGSPLPAGSFFYLTGAINDDITLVKGELYRND